MAIVSTNKGPAALFCVEMPEVWFFDVLRGRVGVNGSVEGGDFLECNPQFLSAIEPKTLTVLSVVPESMCLCGASIDGDLVKVTTSCPTSITILVGGIRKGCLELRMPERTEEQMQRNEQNWRTLNG